MFDLEFFGVVRRILAWSEAPPSHFVGEHEYRIERRKNIPFTKSCIENSRLVSPALLQLHMYVKSSYPAYFGLSLYAGSVFTTFQDCALQRF